MDFAPPLDASEKFFQLVWPLSTLLISYVFTELLFWAISKNPESFVYSVGKMFTFLRIFFVILIFVPVTLIAAYGMIFVIDPLSETLFPHPPEFLHGLASFSNGILLLLIGIVVVCGVLLVRHTKRRQLN